MSWSTRCSHVTGESRRNLTGVPLTSQKLPTGEGNNPLVLATFEGSIDEKPKPRILFYGYGFFCVAPFTSEWNLFRRHYDVISAPPDGWTLPPFALTGLNGYLYGRGVTDNKGPIIAIACAAADLLSRRALEVDLVFLIEGEEEVGSVGFEDAVRKHKVDICSQLQLDYSYQTIGSYRAYRCHFGQVMTSFSSVTIWGSYIPLLATPHGLQTINHALHMAYVVSCTVR